MRYRGGVACCLMGRLWLCSLPRLVAISRICAPVGGPRVYRWRRSVSGLAAGRFRCARIESRRQIDGGGLHAGLHGAWRKIEPTAWVRLDWLLIVNQSRRGRLVRHLHIASWPLQSVFQLLCQGSIAARQTMVGLLADDRLSARNGSEPGDQRNLQLRSARFIPGQPEAVGVPQRLLGAVMLFELLGCEHIFSIGLGIDRFASIFNKSVDLEGAGSLRRLFAARVEEYAPAKSADGGLTLLVKNGVLPHPHHAHGRAELTVLAGAPGDIALHIELVAAAAHCEEQPSEP